MSFRGVNTLACLVLHLGFKPWYNTYTYNTMSGWMSFWGGLAWIWYLGCCNIVCVGDMQGFIPSGFHHVSPFAFSHGSGVSGTSTTCWSSISAHFQLKPWTPSDCNPFPCGMRRELTASLKQLKMQRLWSGSRNSTRCADPTELETTNLRVLAKPTGWWSCWRNTTWMASSNGKFRIYHGFTTSDCKIKDIGHWRWPAGNSWWSGKFPRGSVPLVPCTICTQSASPSQELCSVVSIHLKCAGCIWLLQIHSLNLASLSVRSSLGRLAAATVAWGFFEARKTNSQIRCEIRPWATKLLRHLEAVHDIRTYFISHEFL